LSTQFAEGGFEAGTEVVCKRGDKVTECLEGVHVGLVLFLLAALLFLVVLFHLRLE
jgi:hypothetical protein